MKKKFIDIVSKDKVSGFEEQARKDIANREQLDKEFKEKLKELEERIRQSKPLEGEMLDLLDETFKKQLKDKPYEI